MIKHIARSLYYDVPPKIFRGRALPCRNLIMELTYRCNLSCQMCYIMNEISNRELEQKDIELNKNEILQIIDQLPTGSNVTFTGGEIFLKTGIEEIIIKATERHHVSIATNGLLLNKHAEMLVKAGVQSIGVSLDGPKEIHNTVRNVSNAFEKLANSVQAVLRIKETLNSIFPEIKVNSVILHDNHFRLSEIILLLKEIGIKSCTFQILDHSLIRSGIALKNTTNFNENPLKKIENIDPVHLKQNLQNILEEGKKFGIETKFSPPLTIDEIVQYYNGKFDLNEWECHLPWNTMRISPYGDVYPCMNLYVGNVRENKLSELWNSETYILFRRTLKRASLFQACTGCCKKQRKNPN